MATSRVIDPMVNVTQSKSVCISLSNCTLVKQNLSEGFVDAWKYMLTLHSLDAHASFSIGVSRNIREILLNDINNDAFQKRKFTAYLCISNPITTQGDYMSKLELYGYKLGDEYIEKGYEVINESIDPENVIVQNAIVAKTITSSVAGANNQIQVQPLIEKFNATSKELEEIKVYAQRQQSNVARPRVVRPKDDIIKHSSDDDIEDNVDWNLDFNA